MPGEQTMKPWEQRVTGWGALTVALISLWILWQLEKDRFQNPLAASVGVEWEKERVAGGVNTVPIQYQDVLTLTNKSGSALENIELAVSNWANSTEVKTTIGKLAVGERRRISLLSGLEGFPLGYEIGPRDVLIVRVSGYAEKRIPVMELGKNKSLQDIAKEEDKENNADKDFWTKLRRWESDLKKQGIEPTEDMFKAWLKEKEEARRKAALSEKTYRWTDVRRRDFVTEAKDPRIPVRCGGQGGEHEFPRPKFLSRPALRHAFWVTPSQRGFEGGGPLLRHHQTGGQRRKVGAQPNLPRLPGS